MFLSGIERGFYMRPAEHDLNSLRRVQVNGRDASAGKKYSADDEVVIFYYDK